MDILNKIIQSLNKEEVRFFKLYSKRISSDDERKDLVLFDFIRKNGKEYDESKIYKKLYGEKSKNPFYRLKNRVAEDLNKCLTIQHYADSEEVQIHNLLTSVKLYSKKRAFDLSLHYLKKAEKLAQQIEAFDLLDIIYSEQIKLSQETLFINPEEVIQKRMKNLDVLNSLREMDDVLALVVHRTKTTQNFNSKQNPIVPLLEETVNSVLQNKKLIKGAKLRLKIYRSVSQILLQRHEYHALEDYLEKTFQDFNTEQLFNKSNHDSKLQMLTYMVNCLHINGKYKESLNYAELLKCAMEEFGGEKKDQYLFFYYNALVNNYGTLNKEKAIEILMELKSSSWLQKTPYYEVFVFGNLAILNFEMGHYKKAVKNFHHLYLLESYKNTDESYKFKTEIAELIVRFELHDFDYLEYRIKQVRKDFKSKLDVRENEREKKLLEIIEELIYTNSIRSNKALKKKIELFVTHENKENRLYSEMIDYNNWIKEKLI
ncbi:MAG: hypothetical protein CMP61_07690 [Flavobacteriales bacterium]|nr:hypothetical protein [Flavobacteriales bacterium]|tara:strand:- start:2822 stop:4282 length:1461 start_codon:yes stop_codon:yes gene_type:complete